MPDRSNRIPSDKQSRTGCRSQFKRAAAKALRANATDCERRLWALLRGKQFAQLRFRRQQPVGPYIVDFFCPAAKLVIELDGEQHGTVDNIAYDAARTRWLEARGYCVLRFANVDVLKNREAVLEGIWIAIKACGRPLPEIPSLRSEFRPSACECIVVHLRTASTLKGRVR